MKKPGLKFDKAKLKKFAIHNVEKFAFGLSMLAVAGLIYAGLTKQSYEKTPADVETQVNNARANIQRLQSFNPQDWGITEPQFTKTAERAGDQVPKESFSDLVLGKNTSSATGEKRGEPPLLAVQDLLVSSGVGPFAFINLSVPKVQQQPLPGRPGQGQQAGADGAPVMQQRQPPKKPKGKQDLKDLFQRPAAGVGDGGAGLDGGLPGGEGLPGEGLPGGGGEVPGLDGGMVGGIDGGMGGEAMGPQGVQAPPDSEVKGVQWVCLTALVPHRELVKNYYETFQNAGFTDPMKDYPNYLLYLVERADVTDGDSTDPEKLKWQSLQVQTELDRTRRWAAVAPEVVNPAMAHPVLTFPLGPLLGRNWGKDVAHPKIPLLDAANGGGMGMVAGGGEAGAVGGGGLAPDLVNFEEAKVVNDLDFLKKHPRGVSGYNRGMQGEAGMPGMPGGAGMRTPLMPGGADGGEAGYGGGYGVRRGYGAAGSGLDGGLDGGGAGLPGEGGMFGDGGMGTGMMEPENLLLRFFDFNVKKGHLYRYRVRLVMANPNEGVRPQFLKDAAAAKDPYKLGPWSEPSPVAEVTSYGYILAGPVTPARGLTEAEARAVVVQFDQELGVKATDECRSAKPKEKKVMGPLNRGQLVHYTANIDVVHPLTHQAAQTEMEFTLDMALVDLKGGEPFAPDDKTNRDKIPAELLFLSPNGRLVIKSELDDEREFLTEVSLLEKLKAARENKNEAPLDGGFPDGGIPGEGVPMRRGSFGS
jgi:hypothetical protein